MIRENKLFDELTVGESASVKRVCTANDLFVFAHASGNLNPLHLPEDEHHNGKVAGEPSEPVAPSMWVGALISSVLGNILPGAGTLYKTQTFRFVDRVHVGDELTVTVTVAEKRANNTVVLDTVITGRGGDVVADGIAEVLAPTRKVAIDDDRLPDLLIRRHQHFDRYLEACAGMPSTATAVVAPEDPASLGGALLAARRNLIVPILIGSAEAIKAVAKKHGEDLSGIEIIDVPNHDAAAAKAVQMAHAGQVQAIMKGHLHTDQLLRHIVKRDGGLRTGRRLSHAFIMDVPGLDHVLIVSDAAINISPSLEEKIDITQSAIDLGRSLGIQVPKVGVLSAVETVNPAIPSTLDAAALSKMADRGQITGGLVDGPLAMDNAIDLQAAQSKGITSLVAGRADVLIVPNLEAGNMLAKELAFIAHAEAAGVVLGAAVPIILTSRADGEKARLASCAIAALYKAWQTGGRSMIAEAAE